MNVNDAARELVGRGADATLVTINPDGSPQASLVWVTLQCTPDGAGIPHPHPHRQGRRPRTMGVLRPEPV